MVDFTADERRHLLELLDEAIEGDRFFLSERVRALKGVRQKLRAEPATASASAAADTPASAAGPRRRGRP